VNQYIFSLLLFVVKIRELYKTILIFIVSIPDIMLIYTLLYQN